MKLYFARHGESQANLLREHSNRGFRHPLTERGRAQAANLAAALQDAALSRIYSSPLMRAVQTAEIVSEALGVPYEIADALREYDCGVLEGRSDEDAWRAHMDVFHDWIDNGNWGRHIPGGESFCEIQARFVPFVQGLVEQHREVSTNLLLVGHGGLYRCMLPLVLTNVDFQGMAQRIPGYAGYVVVETQPEGLAWVGQGGPTLAP